jgi:hypothetical protein
MRKQIARCLFVGAWLMMAAGVRGEIIDRVLAAIDNRIITLSDVRLERDVQSVLGVNPASEDVVLQNLVEQYLIEDQIAQFPGIEVSESEIDSEFATVKSSNGLPEKAIRMALRKRIERSKYFELRFRQFITATDEEIQRYYDTVFVPAARDRGITEIPPLSGIAMNIRENVIDEKMGVEVANWIEVIRERSEIETFH